MTSHKTHLGAGSRTLLVLAAAGVIVLALGLWRYGGPEGLWRRAYNAVAPLLPHPDFVPTPLPVAATGTPVPAAEPSVVPRGSPVSAAPLPTTTLTPAVRPTSSPGAGPAAVRTSTATKPVPPSPVATPTQRPQTSPSPAPSSVRLAGLSHYWQTWNNCGPATLAMYLSYFGRSIGQDKIGAVLRPFKDDKNVSPEELAAYARAQGLSALVRVNGTPERLRQLLLADVPVLIETWYEPKPNDGMGHYRLLIGFDDAARSWIAYDSYDTRDTVKGRPYDGIRLPYDEVARLWAVFNRAYVVVYDAPRAAAIEHILSGDLDDRTMWEGSLAAAEAAVQADPADAFARFNLGASLTALGRYPDAAEAFDTSRQIGLPWRMLWYQYAPFRAYYELGRYDEVIALADATLKSARNTIEELYFWKGLAQYAQGGTESARASWQRALELNPSFDDARAALAQMDQSN